MKEKISVEKKALLGYDFPALKKEQLAFHLCEKALENLAIPCSSAVEQPAVVYFSPMGDKRKYADRADYLKAAVSKRRRVLRQKAIEYKGGSCLENGVTQLSARKAD